MPETLWGDIRRCVPTWTTDSIRGAGGVDHRPALHNRMADGLFYVNVRPGLDRGDGSQRVPVVRRGHDGNIRLLLFEQLAVVFVLFGFIAGKLFHLRGRGIQLPLVDVAHSDDFAPAGLNRFSGDIHAPPAAADKSRAIRFAAAGPDYVRDRKGQPGHYRAFEKSATIYSHDKFPFLQLEGQNSRFLVVRAVREPPLPSFWRLI